MRQPYPSDLTSEQLDYLLPHIPASQGAGRPRKVDLREVINAIMYLNRTGCQWRALPHDFPPKGTVAYYYYKWMRDGTWDRLLQLLREQVRTKAHKKPTPSMVIIDSQSTKTTEVGGERGFDGNKKINGRKRHLLVDTLGLVIVVVVTSAGVLDGEGAKEVLAHLDQDQFPRIEKLLGDLAYGKCQLPLWIQTNGYYQLEIRTRDSTTPGFKVVKWRWIVERTFAWLGRYRRHSKDYERYTESSETMIKVSSIHRMLQNLSPKPSEHPFRYARKT